MTKRVPATASILVTTGILAGLAGATLAVRVGEAYGQDAAETAQYDAAPAATPDAAVVSAPPAAGLPPLPSPSDDAPGFVLGAYRWFASGSGWYALVPILILLSWLALHPKMFVLARWKAYQKFVATRRGKVALVALVAVCGLTATALAATGGPPSAGALGKLVPQVLAAMGGYEGIRILILG